VDRGHSRSLRAPGPLDIPQVEDHDDNRRESFDRGREDLELDVLVQERPLPDQRRRSGGRRAGKDHQRGLLHPEPLVRKHLPIAHPVAVLEDTHILHVERLLLPHRIIESEYVRLRPGLAKIPAIIKRY
jgi:hypothetical protein